ncbi:hypothetical protein PHYBOEH_003630 [Phytophthora boehmeriae]|uniref:WW domain-containing protein n=1 Tax=Phytophthora boehmeriae TaxID=109152 RepID=A0A8T1WQP7_9STRA|nr:hypothetical protein PHYBOEH_003630 [Phytophthora boehmeriae]
MLCELRAEEKRRQASAVLIQKFVRQYEAQQVAQLFREALNVVKNEQRRYFGSEDGGIHGDKGWVTHQASSELLTYMTQRFLEDDCCFTTKETRWLRAQVQVAKERLAREDRAVVYLQRYYRGYATRLAFWVHRKQMDELQKLKSKKAVVIQCCARRWLARQRVRRLREQRRLAELKEAYIRERKRKEEERVWKERYDREQMELAVQSAQEAANQLREARREADLARVKAEAAEYRAQELAAEREIETLMNTAVTKKTDEAKDGDWEQFADEYGNVYYYNNRTGESSWDPPPVSSEKKSSDGAEDKDRQPEVKAEEPSKEIDPLEAILREGKCIKCRQALSTKRCLDCEDSGRAFYCNQCFKQEHAAAQHGDWIEIKDGKSAIYFNVETKESTNERPAVLLSGEERHRLQLAEREQLQRSRQVELESEVVKLKEQLRELKAEDRPQSRVEAPAKKVDANQRPNSGATKTDKPEKRGVIGKIFGRNSSQRALTPEAKQTSALSAVITEKQSVGSVAFQQAMVQELAALPQPGSKPK